jgi:type I restriction enzyme S subunit
MKAAAKAAQVPKLRFPRFEGEWDNRSLREHGIAVIDGDRGKNYPNGDDFSPTGYCLFLNAKNVTSSGFAFNEVTFISEAKDGQLSKGKLKANDVVLTTRGTVGNIAFFDANVPYRQMRINSGMVLLRSPENVISPQFLYSAFFAPTIDGEVKKTVFGSAQPQLTVKGIYALKFGAPPEQAEQQKIAAFLTAVDRRIEQLSRKKALLEATKKGVMQQLFTQTLRFQDDHGHDFPDWEEKSFDSIYSFKNTNSLSRDQLTYEAGEVRNIHYGDIHTKFQSLFRLSHENVPFIKPDISITKIADECYCRPGDLVIADVYEDYADVGKCIEVMDLNGEKTVAGLHTFIARPMKGQMAPGFGAYLMQSRAVRHRIMIIAQGTKVLGISKPQLSKMKLLVPHPDEQTKIAGILNAMDGKIAAVGEQMRQTQAWKKGLLQQMFV